MLVASDGISERGRNDDMRRFTIRYMKNGSEADMMNEKISGKRLSFTLYGSRDVIAEGFQN
jgi:hypothetical protein